MRKLTTGGVNTSSARNDPMNFAVILYVHPFSRRLKKTAKEFDVNLKFSARNKALGACSAVDRKITV